MHYGVVSLSPQRLRYESPLSGRNDDLKPALFPILPILFSAFLYLSCSGDARDPVRDQQLYVALYDNPTNLDPRTHADAASFRVIELIYDFLVRMDSTGMPQLDLAEKLETPSDTEYVFTLRRNVHFHDGVLLTAHDVAYTFQSILDPALNAPLRASLENLRKIEVLDSFRVRFSLRAPDAPFLSDLVVGIVPRHLLLNGSVDLKQNPLGSGPFRFRQWDAHARIVLDANEAYWKGAPALRQVVIKILPDATTRALALQNKEVDLLVGNIAESSLPTFRADPRLKVQMSEGSNYVYLALNLENPYLGKRKVRQAIAHALDIDMIIQSLLSGVHQRAVSLLNPRNWAFNPHLKNYAYDPALARRLLDEAGFPDPDGDGPSPRFSLIYKCSSNLLSRQKAQIVQQSLQQVGIEVKVQSHEWGTFFDDIRQGRFDLFSLTMVGVYEPAIYRPFFHSASIGASRNRVNYRNPRVDALIEQAERTGDLDRRRQLYWKIQEIVQDDLPYISLWHEKNIAIMDRRLKGFELYPAGEWRSFYKMKFEPAAANQ